MSLPPRQQAILDQIEQLLQAADPRLKSMFAAFHRWAPVQAMPATEVISGRSARRTVLIWIMVISTLGVLVLGIRASSNDCPGLSSDQVVASAAVRYAACTKSTDVWSKGAR
jgi:3-hydroxyacyl-CoA dehydrogenase